MAHTIFFVKRFRLALNGVKMQSSHSFVDILPASILLLRNTTLPTHLVDARFLNGLNS